MRFETRSLSDLRPAEYNPRVPLTPADPEYQSIKRSIEEFGYADPIVINSDGTIIKGHQRRTVMMDLGYTEVEVIVLDIQDKAKEKALNVALNKITGKWDNAILKDLLLELDLEGYDFSVTGYQRTDLENLIQLVDVPAEAQDDNFDPEAAAADIPEPNTRYGDIWQLGRHRLMCGDSTDPTDVAALMGGNKLDLMVTDPPYNVAYGAKTDFMADSGRGHGHNSIANDDMDEASFYSFIRAFYDNAVEAMRPGAVIYVFHSDTHGLTFRQAFEDAGLKLSECLIWEKNAFTLGRSDYQWRHEPCLYGWKEGSGHYFVKDRTQDTVFLEDTPEFKKMSKQELLAFIDKIFRDYKDQTSVLFENKPARSKEHPTMKPIPLIGRLINNSSKPGWLVGDFFGGSGSTLMAAEQLGRTAYLMEFDERYVDVIINRWEQFTGQKAVKLT